MSHVYNLEFSLSPIKEQKETNETGVRIVFHLTQHIQHVLFQYVINRKIAGEIHYGFSLYSVTPALPRVDWPSFQCSTALDLWLPC